MSARSLALRAVLVALALCCGVGAAWLLDRAGRLPEAPQLQDAAGVAHELALRRVADAPTWLFVLGGALLVGLPVAALARQLRQIAVTQQVAAAHATAAQLASWRDAVASRTASLFDVENAAVQFIADALRRPVQLRPGCLMADAFPAPYFTVTDMIGTRYLLTAHSAVFVRLRLVSPGAPHGNISALSPLAHAEMQALWEVLRDLKALTHIAMPAGGDWQVFVLEAHRPRRSLWQQLRSLQRMRMLTRLPSRAALLSPVLRVELPERPELRSAQRQLLPAEQTAELSAGGDVPALPAGGGGDA